jgi:DNA-binding NtrC family response regulator
MTFLLVHNHDSSLETLSYDMHRQSMRMEQVQTCEEAALRLAGPEPPELVFTSTELPDGTWADIVRLAELALIPVNVIVVSRLADIRTYIEVLQSGAFDFIAPPFEPTALAHVISCAVGNAATRRRMQAQVLRQAEAPSRAFRLSAAS